MKKIINDSKGFSALIIMVFIVVLAAIGYAGYKVMYSQSDSSTYDNKPTQPADKINSQADLNSAESSLEEADLDASLDSGQLDEDINELL